MKNGNIEDNILYRIFVPKPIRTRNFKKKIKQNIVSLYNDSSDKEIISVVDYIKEHGVDMFPYSYTKNYNSVDIEVLFDEEKKMPYVLFDGKKKLYFKKRWRKQKIQKVFNQLLLEQDINSPHRYLSNSFDVSKNDVIVDVGCAEGNFSLEVIEKAKHIYLFESNKEWIEPLKATFEPYKEKVTIINKLLSYYESENTICSAYFFQDKNIDFIKIDVDGGEKDVFKAFDDIFQKQESLKVAFCTYHQKDDEAIYTKLFRERKYEVNYPKGYMIFHLDKKLDAPYLRRGLIRAEK